jgi:murein L,D-transpeptidase YcbB/YkuD
LLPVTIKPVEPGAAYPAAAQLTAILRRLGDLSADAALPPDSNAYAGPLVDAVKRFQARHGLEPDGRIGKATLLQLNTPVSQRIRQLQLTLERWRWAPHNFPVPPIVVNIPEFQLRALNATYGTELEMKVVVGKAYHHQTPVFAADMKYVVFRPYWDVPVSIERAELVPKLDKDRMYLAKNDFEIVTARGEVVSTGVVDDVLLARLRSAELRIRQVPGPKNSLGLVKFLFPNDYSVYLHGTPATELFSKTRRDFSHGCIRVEKPEELAAWVFRDMPEWTPERIHDAMNGEKTIQVTLDRPIPVLVVYATAVALANGEVRFLDDIYKQDAELEQVLAKGYPYSAWKPTSAEPGRRPRE